MLIIVLSFVISLIAVTLLCKAGLKLFLCARLWKKNIQLKIFLQEVTGYITEIPGRSTGREVI
jgi:hypothetical protein